MGSLNKFLRLNRSDQWLLIKATLLVSLVWLGLRLLPFRDLRDWLARAGNAGRSGSAPQSDNAEATRISLAVDKAGRNFLGKDSCFPQALTGEMLLRRRGYHPLLRIGVAKDGAKIKAHAWVELNDTVVIGGPQSQVDQYVPLPTFENLNL